MNPEQVDDGAIRITQQFRARDAMIYDLCGNASRLTLRISGHGSANGPVREWRVEASTSSCPDDVVVAEDGATRADALRAVGRSWSERLLANNLPWFDWESVARAMTAVRAI